ncbi:unnamed protein product [Brachionus calyciflorus]|uniref:Uncharacterized protein n=1 Tax=Brachionus calyciflorus TaxID=104777 RepID=A0A813NCB3_9BILA|nr:unnamed protein product [Brachionus calyciflorus]
MQNNTPLDIVKQFYLFSIFFLVQSTANLATEHFMRSFKTEVYMDLKFVYKYINDLFLVAYYILIVNKWNQLPKEAIEARNLNSFKAKLDPWLLNNIEATALAL